MSFAKFVIDARREDIVSLRGADRRNERRNVSVERGQRRVLSSPPGEIGRCRQTKKRTLIDRN